MPSPIGHALGGMALAWFSDTISVSRRRSTAPDVTSEIASDTDARVAVVCAVLAMAPDLDLLAPYQHRTVTHSLTAVAAVALATILTVAVTGKVTRSRARIVVVTCVAAYASHLLLDWLAFDGTAPRGIQLLWPFSDRWFISDLDLFRGTARRDIFSDASMRANVLAIAQEIASLGPVAAAAWLVRVKALARLPPEVSRRHHAAQ